MPKHTARTHEKTCKQAEVASSLLNLLDLQRTDYHKRVSLPILSCVHLCLFKICCGLLVLLVWWIGDALTSARGCSILLRRRSTL